MASSCSSSQRRIARRQGQCSRRTSRSASRWPRASTRRLNIGVGYGTEEKVRARMRWDHVNFLGGARHAGFEGKWSSLDRGVRPSIREPYLPQAALLAALRRAGVAGGEPVYSLDTLGGRVTLRHQANSQNIWSRLVHQRVPAEHRDPEALEDFTIRDELIALGLDPRTASPSGHGRRHCVRHQSQHHQQPARRHAAATC